LNGVLGPLDIAKDPIRDGVATVTVQVDQLPEGDIVTLARQFDQPRPHERYSSGARLEALHPQQTVAPAIRFKRRHSSHGDPNARRIHRAIVSEPRPRR
jgi:hypothetical protein